MVSFDHWHISFVNSLYCISFPDEKSCYQNLPKRPFFLPWEEIQLLTHFYGNILWIYFWNDKGGDNNSFKTFYKIFNSDPFFFSLSAHVFHIKAKNVINRNWVVFLFFSMKLNIDQIELAVQNDCVSMTHA